MHAAKKEREGQGKRKFEERKITPSSRVCLGPMTRVYQHYQALRFPSEPSTAVTMGRSACHYLVTLKDFFTGSNTAESYNF